MFRNYLVAALRNLARNKLYAAINIIGLAIGFAAAILIALFVRDEFSYDTWIPGHERIYLVTQTLIFTGATPSISHTTFPDLADWLRQDFRFVEATSRISEELDTSVRHGSFEGIESVNWADPNFFDVVPLTVVAGDLKTALAHPDGVVLTRSMARKYFGREDVLGETIELDRQFPVRVTAVIEDLPPNTHLRLNIIGSRLAAFFEGLPQKNTRAIFPYIYVRLTPGMSAQQLERAMTDLVHRRQPKLPFKEILSLVPIADVHLHSENTGSAMKPVDDPRVAYGLIPIGVLIVLMACTNFVNLATARASRRALEVGIRKVTGAFKRDLLIQFMGEALLYATLGMLLAVVLAELLLPSLNAFLGRAIVFDYLHEPRFVAAVAGTTIFIGALAGFYPALLLSAFRPAVAVKKDVVLVSGSTLMRMAFVVVQFAVLIALVVATLVIFRQTQFALNEGLRVDMDQVVLIQTECKTAFPDRVRALPGVRAAACSRSYALKVRDLLATPQVQISTEVVDFGFFELYGLKPVAGRFFSRDHGGDAVLPNQSASPTAVVINEAAVRHLGFASPDAAVGGAFKRTSQGPPIQIIGVVPDFSLESIRAAVPPSYYYVDPNQFTYLNVKLNGRDLPETLQAIDWLWKESGDPTPITRVFLDQEMQTLYLDITQQGQVFGIFASIAVLLACLGLVGLAASTAERRTREIGVRKSMGASNVDILRLLTWEFAKPVLWANLIAWPVAYYFMNRWLHGFAYRIDLAPWMFLAAGGLALVIAMATVSAQSLITARAKPIEALRYE